MDTVSSEVRGTKRRVRQPQAPVPLLALSIAQFCKQFGLSRTTAYKLMTRGKLRFVCIGRRRVIPVEAAEALLRPEGA